VRLSRPLAAGLAACLLAPLACSTPSPTQARLRPTFEVRQVDGGPVPYEQGRPVPTFSLQPRTRIDLDGAWRFQASPLDSGFTFGDRSKAVLRSLTDEAGARIRDGYDDSSWSPLAVPGTFSPPPSSHVDGGWYREQFVVPPSWNGTATLAFQSANYVVDVWLNGTYLGYHEGGWTPFALDATDALRVGSTNTIVVRVDNPPWGTRLDIVPWGLADWWNYGGITGPVWLEQKPPLSVVRADVSPHLDGADVSTVVQNRGTDADGLSLVTEVLPAGVTAANLTDPDARHLVPAGSTPIVSQVLNLDPLAANGVRRVSTSFVIRGADLWSPARPALYVLRVALVGPQGLEDEVYETFGLRLVRVDSTGPRVLLNGDPVVFHGVSMHDERTSPATADRPAGGPVATVDEALAALERARSANADFIRTDHHPANPLALMLADRLGFAIWEEIPLYHYTPETFGIAMDRGVPQQLLAEMALRDMNHPSVLFHGLANESTGGSERTAALSALQGLDRRLDGTRLTGQSAYGSDPADTTSADLDVAGYTFYQGVFYGGPLESSAVGATLDSFHARYPKKPVMILELGRWADSPQEEPEQAHVFDVTYGQIAPRFDTAPGGFIGSAVWWTLDDYWTQRPGIQVEHFGLYRPDGSVRPVGAVLTRTFALEAAAAGQPRPPVGRLVSGGVGAPAGRPGASRELVLLLLYALALPTVLLGALVLLLVASSRRRGGAAA
jgi:beta-galactosidase